MHRTVFGRRCYAAGNNKRGGLDRRRRRRPPEGRRPMRSPAAWRASPPGLDRPVRLGARRQRRRLDPLRGDRRRPRRHGHQWRQGLDPRRGARASSCSARSATAWASPTCRPDPDRRPRRAAHRRRAPPGDRARRFAPACGSPPGRATATETGDPHGRSAGATGSPDHEAAVDRGQGGDDETSLETAWPRPVRSWR